MLDEIESKTVRKDEDGERQTKKKKENKISEVDQVKNICKNLQSISEKSSVQKEVLPSNKLRDHTYEYKNPFGLKEDNLSQRN